ncbi:hypothetical protein [Streptomyces sp. NPDC093707]|uniref:hypothetical protein n=1 Tax=Streptomyces sp. NPDC093707 TaxID=3154984 RepID=UPI00344DBD15
MSDGALEVLIVSGMFLFMATIFGLVGWGWWTSRKEGRNREQLKELIHFATQRGWSYADFAKKKRGRYFTGKVAERVRVYNILVYDFITGTFRGRSFRCFEERSRSVSSDGPDSTLFHVTFEVDLPMAAPLTTIKRRRPLDKLGSLFFPAEKVVELGDPAFDEAFRVISHDEEFARHVLTSGLAQFLVADPRAPHEPLLFEGKALSTTYRARLRVEQVDAKLNYLCDVLDHLPTQG